MWIHHVLNSGIKSYLPIENRLHIFNLPANGLRDVLAHVSTHQHFVMAVPALLRFATTGGMFLWNQDKVKELRVYMWLLLLAAVLSTASIFELYQDKSHKDLNNYILLIASVALFYGASMLGDMLAASILPLVTIPFVKEKPKRSTGPRS